MRLASVRRLWHTLWLNTTSNAFWRADYIRRKKLFGAMGERVVYQNHTIPHLPHLIFVGDNVSISSGVTFLTHDAIHRIFTNCSEDGFQFKERMGPIRIGNNCFIGAGSILCGPVTIGDNVIVAAGSVVVSDLPSGTVVGGVPARVIGSFEDLMARRREESLHADQ